MSNEDWMEKLIGLSLDSPRCFEYLICLDFEATCWDVHISVQRTEQKQEIIEFGAVLLNFRSGAIESEFHDYVRPINNPILSDYCTNLTGITQTLIDRQQPFPVVYQKFNNWLHGLRAAKQLTFATPLLRTGNNCNTTFCSWSNWDLGNYFRWDCVRHGIERPDYLRAWIDARKIFDKLFLPRKIHCGFNEALEYMNIVRTGNAHSGIDDARMLAELMQRLYQIQTSSHRRWINEATTYNFVS